MANFKEFKEMQSYYVPATDGNQILMDNNMLETIPPPFSKCGNQGPERLGELPRDTELDSDAAATETSV